MILKKSQKEALKKELTECLQGEPEITRIVIFGSFTTTESPNDLDVAIFQDSKTPYIPLAMKYRKKTRPIAKKIPLDIFPLKTGTITSPMLTEIDKGEVIYER